MKVHHRNAISLLYERTRILHEEESHRSWRCIYINLSEQRQRYSNALLTHFVTNAVVNRLTKDDGDIYLCENGDIFIMFEGIAKPILNKLAHHFADMQAPSDEKIFTVFDLDTDWYLFYQVCESKRMEKIMRQHQQIEMYPPYGRRVARSPQNATQSNG